MKFCVVWISSASHSVSQIWHKFHFHTSQFSFKYSCFRWTGLGGAARKTYATATNWRLGIADPRSGAASATGACCKSTTGHPCAQTALGLPRNMAVCGCTLRVGCANTFFYLSALKPLSLYHGARFLCPKHYRAMFIENIYFCITASTTCATLSLPFVSTN